MAQAEILAEIWRGDILESVHSGHAVICTFSGDIVAAWGNPDKVILPRSACKMIQAIPLVESGAAEAFGLKVEHLALACASHQGAAMHTDRVTQWLADIGFDDSDLRCGAQEPSDIVARDLLIKEVSLPCQMHNNCSGKHTGFLTLARHLHAGPEYIDIDHPVQVAVREAFEDLTGTSSHGFAIDGCSAPNFATTLHGLARAMAKMAAGETGSRVRDLAAARLVAAMARQPELVAGTTRACTELMQAMGGMASIKTGAEGVFVAILPGARLGVAIKIEDGATRAAECAIAALLVRLGVADADHPLVRKRLQPTQINRAGREVGFIRPGEALWQGGTPL